MKKFNATNFEKWPSYSKYFLIFFINVLVLAACYFNIIKPNFDNYGEILNKIANTIVDISNIPVRTPNKIKTFFFNEDTTGIGSLQGNKGFNV